MKLLQGDRILSDEGAGAADPQVHAGAGEVHGTARGLRARRRVHGEAVRRHARETRRGEIIETIIRQVLACSSATSCAGLRGITVAVGRNIRLIVERSSHPHMKRFPSMCGWEDLVGNRKS